MCFVNTITVTKNKTHFRGLFLGIFGILALHFISYNEIKKKLFHNFKNF